MFKQIVLLVLLVQASLALKLKDLNGTWKLSKLENEKSQPVQTGEFKFVIAGSEGNQQIGFNVVNEVHGMISEEKSSENEVKVKVGPLLSTMIGITGALASREESLANLLEQLQTIKQIKKDQIELISPKFKATLTKIQ